MPLIRLFRAGLLALFLAAAGLFLMPRSAQAVVLSCTPSMTLVDFGTVDVLPGTALTTNASLTVTCNVSLLTPPIYMCITFQPFSMPGSPPVAWTLNDPAIPSAAWSNTKPVVVPAILVNLQQSVTVNVPATIFAGQGGLPPGTYTQTVTGSATWSTTNCTAGDLLNSGVATLNVQARVVVQKSCNITASNLTFPTVTNLNSPVNGQSSLSVQCTKNTGYTIGLNGGTSNATDPTARFMKAGSDSVRYGLYQQPNGSTPWGNTAANWLGGTGTATTQTIPVYGRVPIQPTPPPNTYQDTIIATVTY